MKIAVFIPGRLKSERLPNKLILPIKDTNLWNEACKKLNDLPDRYEKIAFCYDEELVEIASKYSNIRIILRDESTTVIDGPNSEIFRDLKQVDATHLMYFHPCFMFIDINTILNALQEFEEKELDYMTSVQKYQNWLYKDGKNIVDIDEDSWSTKTVNGYMIPTHNFFLFKKDEFFKTSNYLPPNHNIYEVSEKDSIDVNTYEELEYVKWRYENENNK